MTANWMSGYVADVTYTLGFYRELAPTFLNFACVINGVAAPEPEKPLRYCELGCGRGYGTILLAAANPNSQYVGIDFNPAHIAEARGLANRAGITNVTFLEMGFGDAAASSRPELADFDIVALHGVYTWVVPEVRRQILDFVREKLVSGGLVFVSYNCMPGWTAVLPIQRLMMELGERSSRQSVAVIDESLDLLKKLVEHSSAFIAQNPTMKARIEKMTKQDRSYLAHEFFNEGWMPTYVTDVIKEFGSAKATYVGSAAIVENRPDLSAPRDLIPLIRDAPDVGMKELLKDYAINKQFRRDIYVKGPQRLNAREQRQKLNELVFVKAQMTDSVPEKFQLPIGELKPKPEIMRAMMKGIGSDPMTGERIIAAAMKAGFKESDAILYLMLLVNGGVLLPARRDHASIDRNPSRQLNATIMEMSAAADTHRFLASPVTGSAIGAGFTERVFAYSAAAMPKATNIEVAELAFDRLAKAGQSFRRDGKAITKSEDSMKEIGAAVGDFRTQRLPRWQSLGVI
ncbi:MAG: methyltransferase regulatory domain-containing protein [Xanthobacteraceae bacterium]|nr:methyltransferase regulatory domain-containing protein [Xanthobacteraceae bacterium]